MKYIDEFRDGAMAAGLAEQVRRQIDPPRTYRLMEFCGGHTHAIHRYGIPDLLPGAIELIHGPGCPVCVLPVGRIDAALQLAVKSAVTLCTYADLMRVPASQGKTLFTARAEGADIRMVYSPLQALDIARQEPRKSVVFFAIGFETTTPPTAITIQKAAELNVPNFSVFCNHVLTPAAIQALLSDPVNPVQLDGIIGPAHVSTVIGTEAYAATALQFNIPIVIAGFEPLDVMQSILMLIRQINEGRAEVENEYTRSVTREGNVKARAIMDEVLEVRDSFSWRGLGSIPRSGLSIRPRYAGFDAEQRFEFEATEVIEPPGCACGAVLQGRMKPKDCKLFGRACTPDTPVGACMVSSEGACAAWYTYGRHR